MKKFLVVFMLGLAACSPKRELVDIYNGAPGANGHSIVSIYQSATELECSSGGSRLDMYLDMDYSLSANAADKYTNSIIVCNGSNGLNGAQGTPGMQGPQGVAGGIGPQGPPGLSGNNGAPGSPGSAGPMGPQGPTGPQGIQGPAGSAGATITVIDASNCTLVPSSSPAVYAKANGGNFKLYSNSSCSGNSLEELNEGHSFWVAAKALLVMSSGSLRVISFN